MQIGATAPPKRKFKLYYGWVIVAVFAICHFTESAEIYPVIAVMMKPMTEEFGWSRTTFTLATSIGTLLGGMAGPFIGPMVDKHGAKWILLIGFTLLGSLMIATALVQEVWHWYVIQIASRFLSQGVLNLALSIMIPNWFIKNRARATAFGGMGGRLGNSITPIYVQAIITAYSWRYATVTTGIVILALTLVPIALFVKRRPEDMGLLPDGQSREDYDRGLEATKKAREEAAAAGRKIQIGAVAGDVSFGLREVLRMSSFYFLMGSTVTATLVGPAMNLHMVPYFTDKGLSPQIAVLVTTTLFLSSSPGNFLGAILVERYGVRPVIIIDGVLQGFWFFFLLAVNSPMLGFIWAVTQGLLQGASGTVRQVIFPDYYGRNSLGAIRGVMTPINLASNAIGPTVAALAFDATGNYVAIFIVFGILRTMSAFLVAFAKPPEGSMAALGRTSWTKSGGGGGRGH